MADMAAGGNDDDDGSGGGVVGSYPQAPHGLTLRAGGY